MVACAGPAARDGTAPRPGRDAGLYPRPAQPGAGSTPSPPCASACWRSPGYEDADDCDALRPTLCSSWPRAARAGKRPRPLFAADHEPPGEPPIEAVTAALVDIFCRSFPAPPAAFDIDDTCDPVHGHQPAHYDTRCFLRPRLPCGKRKPVAVLLRPGKTPSGAEVRTLLKHLVRRIRRHFGEIPTMAVPRPWPGARRTASTTSSAWRAIPCCTPSRMTWPSTSRCAVPRPGREDAELRRLRLRRPFLHRPDGGDHARLRHPLHRHLAERRGPTKILLRPRPGRIKLHKGQLASDRTSCQSPLANQLWS